MFNQVNFTCVDKIFGPKKFTDQKDIWSKHFWVKKNWVEKNIGQKKFCKHILRKKLNFGQKKVFGPKRCLVQKCLVYKICGRKIIWSK